jgi:hypothetical protein
LRKDKANALSYHEKATRIYKTDIYPGVKMNIKLAKLVLLKGVWMGKLDLEASNDELGTAFSHFEEIFETPDNYYGANCMYEIGANYTKMKQL